MARRTQVKKDHVDKKQDEVTEVKLTPQEKGEKLKKELDDILDNIDSVLEEDAASFVRDFRQRGGQ